VRASALPVYSKQRSWHHVQSTPYEPDIRKKKKKRGKKEREKKDMLKHV